MKNLLVISFILILNINDISGQIKLLQQKPDCNIANVLVTKDTVIIDTLLKTIGVNLNEVNNNSCLETEFASSWFKWTCTNSGTLTFTIMPFNIKDDIDFMIFESDQNDCANMIPIRCMAAGETISGDSLAQIRCLGNTGLSLTSVDVVENPGCAIGNDNFLKALDMVQGKSYSMVVNNFSLSGLGYKIVFGGDGEIGISTGIKNDEECKSFLTSNLVSDVLYFNDCKKFSKLNIFDYSGKLLLNTTETINKINVDKLYNGLHFVSIYDVDNNLIMTEKFYVSR